MERHAHAPDQAETAELEPPHLRPPNRALAYFFFNSSTMTWTLLFTRASAAV